jgi:hypothetical protein
VGGQGFRRRLVETPGVVATKETPIDSSIEVQAVEPPTSHAIDRAFDTLRNAWETPDGWPIADGLAMFRHARELALGFFYRWNPRPPKHWLDARREWCSYVRQVLKHSRTLDSELQVRRAHPNARVLQRWLSVRDDFEPNTEPVWLCESVLNLASDWADKHGGIVWTEHTCFGMRLWEDGLRYYGRRGQDPRGRAIDDHPPGKAMIASIQSNAEGRNLQAWCENLVISPPPNGQQWEQLIGRTHRDGQTADAVSFDVFTGCAEHVGAIHQAVRDCEYVLDSTGSPQKLLLAALDVPDATSIALRSGARWG